MASVVGIIGYPLAHSLSPRMHNAAFVALGLDFVYVPFPVKPVDLPTAIAGLRALNIRGCNVTIPHKEAVLPFLDNLTPEAELMGAVNTIINDEGRLTGHNTDGPGFMRSLADDAGVDPAGCTALILGTGGAARAVAVALAMAGAGSVYVAGRTTAKAEAITRVIETRFPAVRTLALAREERLFAEKLAAADIFIHATPIGMYPHHDVPPAIDPALLPPHALVCDLVYNPEHTTLLAAAAARGRRTLAGTGMLVCQGALAFTLWTGCPAPVEVMRKAVSDYFAP